MHIMASLPFHKGLLLLPFLLSLPLVSQSEDHDPPINPRLEKAYEALQAWKHAITSDPKNVTLDWCGPHVCNYTGIFCAPAPDDRDELTVAGIDLNQGQIAGTLPEEIGLLADLALLHINSNRFEGTLPESFKKLKLLYELDLSNNLFDGPFPAVVLELPALKYLDIRFNRFNGRVPQEVFNLKLDALFINDNQFDFSLPDNIGNSTVSVLVLANNRLSGCFPRGITSMGETLQELILLNSNISSCIPQDIGKLHNLRVFDVSFNSLVGPLPESVGEMKNLEQLDVAHNRLSGEIPASVCELPRLQNFTYAFNYFCAAPEQCLKIQDTDDSENCIPERPKQRTAEECSAFKRTPVHCDSYGCMAPSPPPPAHN